MVRSPTAMERSAKSMAALLYHEQRNVKDLERIRAIYIKTAEEMVRRYEDYATQDNCCQEGREFFEKQLAKYQAELEEYRNMTDEELRQTHLVVDWEAEHKELKKVAAEDFFRLGVEKLAEAQQKGEGGESVPPQ